MINSTSLCFDLRPQYFERLSSADQLAYDDLRAKISEIATTSAKFPKKLPKILELIQNFCRRLKESESDGDRCLVCGVCWLFDKNSVAINIKNFRVLLNNKNYGKSMIKLSFQKLGYVQQPAISGTFVDELIVQIPFLKTLAHSNNNYNINTILNNDNKLFNGLREWSIFQMAPTTPQPISPSLVCLGFDHDRFKKPEFFSPAPQMNIIDSTAEEMKVRAEKFEEKRNDFFFNDPFCLPPTFMFEDWN